MSLDEPFDFEIGDLVWRLYTTTRNELNKYGRSVAENILIWILSYYLICGCLYTLIFYYKRWSCSMLKGVKRALFVIAHPDDECMFFGPTIIHFIRQGVDVHLICLSKGNYDGAGYTRIEELWKACLALGIKSSHITLYNDGVLPDDPKVRWPPDRVAEIISSHVEQYSVDTLVTFDKDGVSYHSNHRAIFYAVAYLSLGKKLPLYCNLYTLDSVNLLRKYWGYLDLPLSFLLASNRFILSFRERKFLINAMKQHKSQMLWFRHLYLLFSRFIIMNTLKEVTILDLELELELEE